MFPTFFLSLLDTFYLGFGRTGVLAACFLLFLDPNLAPETAIGIENYTQKGHVAKFLIQIVKLLYILSL